MTGIGDIAAARVYHEGTKHPGGFLMNPRHFYHPGLEPLPFKIYEGLESITLPLETSPIGLSALEAIAAPPRSADTTRLPDLTTLARLPDRTTLARLPDLTTLARLLYFSAGVTKRIRYSWGEMYFRAAACTGALYHIELYAACGNLPGLDAGVYHYEPHNHTLVRLRSGDFRAALVDATGAEPHIAAAPLILIYTDMWWRNAVKYQARAYRHTYWDGGTILSHTLAMCAAHDLPAHVVMGFGDPVINDLLGLDTSQEAAFALLAVGHTSEPAPPAPEVKPLHPKVRPISDRQITFQPILDVHAASSLPGGASAAAWRERTPPSSQPAGGLIQLPSPGELPSDPIETVIIRRGSTRRFSREPIMFEQLAVLLRQATQGLSADFLKPFGASLNMPYLIVHAVDGLAPGSYAYHPDRAALELIHEGQFRTEAGQLALGQDLAADSAANIYFMTDLGRTLDSFGNRGYRAAQLEAAISAGRMYLAAYGQQFGATGLTFFDDAVTRFFFPHAMDKAVMFLLAVGHKARRSGM